MSRLFDHIPHPKIGQIAPTGERRGLKVAAAAVAAGGLALAGVLGFRKIAAHRAEQSADPQTRIDSTHERDAEYGPQSMGVSSTAETVEGDMSDAAKQGTPSAVEAAAEGQPTQPQGNAMPGHEAPPVAP